MRLLTALTEVRPLGLGFCWYLCMGYLFQPVRAWLSCFSRVLLFATLWAVARQASLSLGVSRQVYWSGLPCPASGDPLNPGIEPISLMSPALAGRFFTTRVPPGKPSKLLIILHNPVQCPFLSSPSFCASCSPSRRCPTYNSAPGVSVLGTTCSLAPGLALEAEMLSLFQRLCWGGHLTSVLQSCVKLPGHCPPEQFPIKLQDWRGP